MPAQTRGFLFSDIRGYSAFAERHGDRAARELLTRYRRTVREAIGHFDGAEIRTEGDSFYVVFDSVSQAVEAALAVQAELQDSEGDGEPIRAGIGVHAGEVEDDAEQGIVSSAVNIAARICSVAEPGEVLVSDTVRALTRSYLQVTYIPRGRRRLKGIVDPVPVYRVLGRGALDAQSNRRNAVLSRRSALVAFAGGGLVVLVAAAAFMVTLIRGSIGGLADYQSSPPFATSTGETAGPSSAAITSIAVPPGIREGEGDPVSLEQGRPYRFTHLEPVVTFEVPDDGWSAYRDYLDAAGLLIEDIGEELPAEEGMHMIGGVDFGRIQVVYAQPCVGADTRLLASTPGAVAEWLEESAMLETSAARPVNVAGYSGIQVDVLLPEGTDPCPSDDAGEVAYLFPLGEDEYWLAPGERLRLTTLDVAGRPFTILTYATDEWFEEIIDRSTQMLDTLRLSGV